MDLAEWDRVGKSGEILNSLSPSKTSMVLVPMVYCERAIGYALCIKSPT